MIFVIFKDVSMDIDVIKDDGSNSSAMDTEENAKTKIEYKQGMLTA